MASVRIYLQRGRCDGVSSSPQEEVSYFFSCHPSRLAGQLHSPKIALGRVQLEPSHG